MILVLEEDIEFAKHIKVRLKKIGFDQIILTRIKKDALKVINEHRLSMIILCVNSAKDLIECQDLAQYIHSKFMTPVIFVSDFYFRQVNILNFQPAALIPKSQFSELFSLIAFQLDTSENQLCKNNDFVFILKNNRYYKVHLKDIYFVHADGGCIKIKTRNSIYTLSSTIKKFKEQIEHSSFINVHRSYLINTIHIETFDSHNLVIGDCSIPISKKGMHMLLERVKKIKSK